MEGYYLQPNKNNFMKHIRYSLLVLLLFLALFTISCSKDGDFIEEFVNYPNPFNASNEYTTYHVKVDPNPGMTSAILKIFSSSGNLLADIDMAITLDTAVANWHGVDKNGNKLPSSVYYAEITVENSEGNIARASTKTLIE